MKRKWLAIGIILLFVGVTITPAIAQNTEKSQTSSRGNWLYVGGSGPGNYTRIQDAINDSSQGDTVFVYHGNYTENIVINKSISVLGENKETTWISGYGYYLYDHVVFLIANNVIFSGFTVYLIEQTCPGISINDSQNCIVSNNIVKSTWGIQLINASKNIVNDNIIFTTNGGIDIGDYPNYICKENIIENNTITNSGNSDLIYNFGICLWETAINNTIKGNFLYDCVRDGIYLYNAKNNIIQQNHITCYKNKMEYGICLVGEYTSGNIIVENDVSNYTYGILTNYNENLLISGNFIHDNTYGSYNAAGPINLTITNNTFQDNNLCIDIQGGNNITIEGNIITSNGLGLLLEYSTKAIIRKNNITFNKGGLVLFLSPECQVVMNNFIRNRRNAESHFCRNTWDNNYWNRPRIYPKPIFGTFPFIQFDKNPAQEPYDIPGMNR
jgi:nitrous oxidase accessory protein